MKIRIPAWEFGAIIVVVAVLVGTGLATAQTAVYHPFSEITTPGWCLFVMSSSVTSCPAGYSKDITNVGKFMLIDTVTGTGGSNVHDHTYAGQVAGGTMGYRIDIKHGSAGGTRTGHWHYYSNTTHPATVIPEYTDVMVCCKD
jgi:hypothetical protein